MGMRMRRKKNIDARLDRCASVLTDNPAAYKGTWREAMGSPAAPLYLEIGCGKGRFVRELAARSPDCRFVAVERYAGALIIAAEQAIKGNLTNLRFISGDALCLSEYFSPGELTGIYLNFSDPWPAPRHARRRLTHRNYLYVYDTLLSEGGHICLKTDNNGLFEYSLEEFSAYGFRIESVTRDLHSEQTDNIMTEYEEKFAAMGNRINRCCAFKPGRL